MKIRTKILLVSAYKTITNLVRIILGLTIIYFGFDIHRALRSLFSREIQVDPKDFIFSYLIGHINDVSYYLAAILAFSLIILSLAEIFFIIQLLRRKKWGAIGFLVISILWIPVELLFVSKFILVPRTITLIIEIIIIIFLFRIIRNSHGYFKKN
jgi:uncharacterized membrane protein